MPEDLPLPEWPKPSREDGASAEASPFDPVPVNDGGEIADFRVPVNDGGEIAELRVPVNDGGEIADFRVPVNDGGEIADFRVPVNDGGEIAEFRFDPVPVNGGGEIAEFRVEAGTQDGDVQVVPVSGQESQGEVLRSIERHLERIVDLIEDMTG